MKGNRNRVILFGGSFNPIHFGHLRLAEEAHQLLKAPVVFLPTGTPPHKKRTEIPAEKRMKIVLLGIADNPAFSASDWELRREGISYTYITVKEFSNKWKEIFWLVGPDWKWKLDTWKNWEELKEMAKFVVPVEKEEELESLSEIYGENCWRFLVPLRTKILPINSTLIREKIRKNESVRYLLPREVEEYVIKMALYSSHN